jgi:5-methylcytosine-specific restriction endonuclease McrA
VVHDVRYRPGDSAQNLILRSALWDAWKYRCCWCRHSRDLLDVEIDHLIPQSSSGPQLQAKLADNLTDELLALPFDIHALHNLGPGCHNCNGEKGDRDFLTAPRFMALLAKARELEPAVIQTVRRFHSGNAFTKAIATVTGVDPTGTGIMETLAELGPALITRLRYIAPHIVEGPSDYDYFDPEGDATDEYIVTVTLDETSRRARVLLEDAYGCDFDAALVTVVRAVIEEICQQLGRAIAHVLEDRGYDPDVAPVNARIDLAVNRLTVDPDGPQFELQGTYQADGTAEAAIQNYRNDSGTSWIQRDADEQGHFTATFFPGDSPAIEVDYVDLSKARAQPPRWKLVTQ